MKKSYGILLFIACVLLMPLSAVSAQQTPCDLDLSQINTLAEQAQQQADVGDIPGALQTITAMRDALRDIQTNCGADAALNFAGMVAAGPGATSPDADSSQPIELTESASVADEFSGGTITVSYPSGWAAGSTFGTLILATSQDTLDLAVSDTPFVQLSPDELVISLSVVPTGEGIPLPDDNLSADGFLSYFLASLTDVVGGQATFDEVETFTINGLDGALTYGLVSDANETLAVAVVVIMNENFFVLGIAVAAPGQLEGSEALLLAIIASVEYEPAAD